MSNGDLKGSRLHLLILNDMIVN